MSNILVTGGAGFIGSHTVVELIAAGLNPIILDNFINSNTTSIKRLEKVTNKKLTFVQADVRDSQRLSTILSTYSIDAVIHFAALKAVGESSEQPLTYYQNNIIGLLSLLESMAANSITKLIFSSSATVYGDPDRVPIRETDPLKETTNPYGETKKMSERIIQDVCKSSQLKAVILRYFNPIGAHPSGFIGEEPRGIPNNLVPYIVQAAAGIRQKLTVYGNDYNTPDGSGVRDYIHVVDLARAHVKALEYIQKQQKPTSVFNIGTGKGVSVLELIQTFENVNNTRVPYEIGPRRPGDISTCFAAPDKAKKELGWKASLSIEDALRDAWRWQQQQQRK